MRNKRVILCAALSLVSLIYIVKNLSRGVDKKNVGIDDHICFSEETIKTSMRSVNNKELIFDFELGNSIEEGKPSVFSYMIMNDRGVPVMSSPYVEYIKSTTKSNVRKINLSNIDDGFYELKTKMVIEHMTEISQDLSVSSSLYFKIDHSQVEKIEPSVFFNESLAGYASNKDINEDFDKMENEEVLVK